MVEVEETRLEDQLAYIQGGFSQGKVLIGSQTGLQRGFRATRCLAPLADKAGSCFAVRYAS
jgi:hypothetical protein